MQRRARPWIRSHVARGNTLLGSEQLDELIGLLVHVSSTVGRYVANRVGGYGKGSPGTFVSVEPNSVRGDRPAALRHLCQRGFVIERQSSSSRDYRSKAAEVTARKTTPQEIFLVFRAKNGRHVPSLGAHSSILLRIGGSEGAITQPRQPLKRHL